MRQDIALAALATYLLGSPGCAPGGMGPGRMEMMGPPDDPGGAAFTFDLETVDPAASGAAVALVVDGKGAPHVLYFSGGDEMVCNQVGTPTTYRPAKLWHATRAGVEDFVRREVSGNDAEVNGVSAALDPRTDRPAVAYQGGNKGIDICAGSDMMLGRFDGVAWQRTTVADRSTAGVGPVETSGDVVGVWSALAISKSGMWYLAWQDIHFGYAKDDFFKADLEFAAGPDGNLRTGEGVQQDGAGVYTSIAIDGKDRPVLAYSSHRDGGVTVAVRTAPGMWRATRLFTGGQVVPSLAAAPRSGRLGLAYYDPELRLLRLRESDDGITWGPPDVVDHDGDVGRAVSLRYDSQDRPVAAYYRCGRYRPGQGCDPTMDELRVARREAELWRTARVEDGGEGACGAALSLWLTPDDRIHLAYQCTVFDHRSNQFRSQVRYARQQ